MYVGAMRASALVVFAAMLACRKDRPKVTAAPEIRATPEGFQPVRAHNGDPASATSATLWLTDRTLHMSHDAAPLLTVPAGEHDFAATDKRDGKGTDLLLPALQAALLEKCGDAGAGLLLHVDARATYRMFVDVVYTSAQAGFSGVAVAVDDGKVIPLTFPKIRAPRDGGLELDLKLPPTVVIVGDGFVVKTSKGSISEGCDHVGPGITIRGHDAKALGACLQKLRVAVPALGDEHAITFSANPDIRMQVLADGWSAARAERFTELTIGILR